MLVVFNITNPTDSDSSTFLCSIADASVYPASIELHNKTVNMIANLWHAPKPPNGQDFTGAGTVGSTEGAFIVNFYYHLSHMLCLYSMILCSIFYLNTNNLSMPLGWFGPEVSVAKVVRQKTRSD